MLYGPDDEWPPTGCRFVRDAWSEFDLSVAATANYQPGPEGLDTAEVTMLLPAAAGGDELIEMTLGLNDRLGRPRTPLGHAEQVDHDAGMPAHLQNLADAGVKGGMRQRMWTALIEMVQTHPEISLACSGRNKPRNLPDHKRVDRAVLGRGEAEIEPAARPAAAGATAGSRVHERAAYAR